VRRPPTAVREVSETAAQKMEGHKMPKTTEKANKVLVLKAVRCAFQQAQLQGSRALLVTELH
jgi:hypothetical protein